MNKNLLLKEIYDARYTENYREQFTGIENARKIAIEHFIIKVLQIDDAKLVLDYGAGSGLYVNVLEKIFKNAQLFCCDISQVALDKLVAKHRHLSNRTNLIGMNQRGVDDNKFDVILSIEVMEHVQDLDKYLLDIFRLLRPGGSFVWTTPCANLFSIEHLYSFLTGQIEKTEEGLRRWSWEDPTHLRRLKSIEIRNMMDQIGFSNFTFRFRSHFFAFLVDYYLPRWLKRIKGRLLKCDYQLFRLFPNGASMIGSAQKSLK